MRQLKKKKKGQEKVRKIQINDSMQYNTLTLTESAKGESLHHIWPDIQIPE